MSLYTVGSSTVAGKITCLLRAKSAIDLRSVLPIDWQIAYICDNDHEGG